MAASLGRFLIPPRAWVVGACAASLVLGCVSAPSSAPGSAPPPSLSAPSVPTFAVTECPDDVSSVIVVTFSCGYLSVPENRASANGRTIHLLVVRIEPPGGTSTPDPVVVVGDERLGGTPNYGGLVELSQRVHRIEYVVDPRGAGHSEAKLECPEIKAARLDLVGTRFRDPVHQAALLGAVKACRDRLVATGVDLASYDFAETAADFRDLRRALGFDQWNAIAWGPASELALEIAGRYPEGLRTIVLVSPTLSDPNFIASGPAALDLSIARLSDACRTDTSCRKRFPDLAASIASAVAILDTQPLTFEVDGTPQAMALGHPVHTVLDGSAVLRTIRASLGSERPDGVTPIMTVGAILDGSLGKDAGAVQRLSSDIGDCIGILPLCDGVDFATLYAITCRDEMTPHARDEAQTDAAGRPAYVDLFAPGPLGAACQGWGVDPASSPSGSPLGGNIPTLLLRGAFDPYSSTPAQIAAAGVGPNIHILEVPNGSYNVLGPWECVRSIRNAWVDDPSGPPADTSCLAAMPGIRVNT